MWRDLFPQHWLEEGRSREVLAHGVATPSPLPADGGTEALGGREPGARSGAGAEPTGQGKEGKEGVWDTRDWARWSEGVGLWPGWVVGLPAPRPRPGRGQQGSGWRAVDPAQQ